MRFAFPVVSLFVLLTWGAGWPLRSDELATNATPAAIPVVSTTPDASSTPPIVSVTNVAPSSPPAIPPAATPPLSGKKYAADLDYRFYDCVFDSPQFPGGSFAQDSLVKDSLGPVQVQTTFYDGQFKEVTQADHPGRYGAVVRIKLGDGTETNRYITLYRSPKKLFWRLAKLHLSLKLPPEWGIDPRVARAQRADIDWSMTGLIRDAEVENSQLAVILAGLSEMKSGAKPAVHRNGAQARDDAWWFKLRMQLNLMPVYPYLEQLPDGYDAAPAKKWPLILFLHGSGERGTDLAKVSVHGPPMLIAQGSRKIPAIVISPQCPEHEGWSTGELSLLLDDLEAKYRIDPDRIIVTGLSMGGYGSWALALAEPHRFAAVVPVCGGGDPADAARLAKLPIWVFHGGKDAVVPKQLAFDMVHAVRDDGGHAHLTIFPNDEHDSWTDAYNTDALYTWMLAQRRGHPEAKTPGVPGG